METVKLMIVKDRLPPKIFVQTAIATLAHSPVRSIPEEIPARRGRRLDVDAVLARSLPKVAGEQVHTRVSKELEAA